MSPALLYTTSPSCHENAMKSFPIKKQNCHKHTLKSLQQSYPYTWKSTEVGYILHIFTIIIPIFPFVSEGASENF